jgi:hypothetical protein
MVATIWPAVAYVLVYFTAAGLGSWGFGAYASCGIASLAAVGAWGVASFRKSASRRALDLLLSHIWGITAVLLVSRQSGDIGKGSDTFIFLMIASSSFLVAAVVGAAILCVLSKARKSEPRKATKAR